MTDELTPGEDAPLSITDAANAYATVTTEEAPEGQAAEEKVADGETADVEDTELSEEESEETDEGESDDQGETEDESGDEQDEPGGRFVPHAGKVQLPDGSFATVAELIEGNLRRQDYTRKTMEHGEAVKAFQSQSSAIKQQEQEVAKRTEFVTSLLKSIVPPQPDPNLADPRSPKYDPQAYMAQRAQHDYWAGHLNKLQADQDQAEQARQTATANERAEMAKKEWERLTEAVPELKEQAKAEAFAKEVLRTGQSYGFTEQELLERLPTDHRFSLALRDAQKWKRFEANKAKVQKKVESRPPVQKGGQRLDPQRAKAREGRAAMDRLNQTGSLRDGVAALLAIEGKG